jgi:hypothetical protein
MSDYYKDPIIYDCIGEERRHFVSSFSDWRPYADYQHEKKDPYWTKFSGNSHCDWCGSAAQAGQAALYYKPNKVIMCSACAKRPGAYNNIKSKEIVLRKECAKRKRGMSWQFTATARSCDQCGSTFKSPHKTLVVEYPTYLKNSTVSVRSYFCEKCGIKYEARVNAINNAALKATEETDTDMTNKTTAQKLIGEPKKDASEAAYRVAADQLVKTVKGPVAARLTAGTALKDDVALVLATEPGEALLAVLLAAAVDMTPVGNEQMRARLAHELRVAAYTKVGTQLADLIGEPVREALATVKVAGEGNGQS